MANMLQYPWTFIKMHTLTLRTFFSLLTSSLFIPERGNSDLKIDGSEYRFKQAPAPAISNLFKTIKVIQDQIYQYALHMVDGVLRPRHHTCPAKIALVGHGILHKSP